MSAQSTVVDNIARLITNDVRLDVGATGELHDAWVVMADGLVALVGTGAAPAADQRIDAAGRCVLPGFVDSHSHLVFGGERSEEFAARMAGRPYQAGGIRTTVAATRAASDEDLSTRALTLLAESRRSGTTTIEIKSGYGLTTVDEARTLGVAARLTDETTFLGAHVVPPEFDDRVDDYVDLVCGEMLAACAPHSRWIDAFCERGAFDVDQSRAVLLAGRDAGLGMRLHANQLGHGPGVKLAVELGCASADHCTYLDDDDIAALAGSSTVATFLPATDFSTRQPYPDAAPTARRRRCGRAGDELQPGLELHDLDAVLHRAGGPRHEHDHRRGDLGRNGRRGGRAAARRHRQDRARRSRRSDHPRHGQPDRLRLPAGRAPRGDHGHRRLACLSGVYRTETRPT